MAKITNNQSNAMQVKVEVPDSLAQKLQPFSDRLPEVLERGAQQLLNEQVVLSSKGWRKTGLLNN